MNWSRHCVRPNIHRGLRKSSAGGGPVHRSPTVAAGTGRISLSGSGSRLLAAAMGSSGSGPVPPPESSTDGQQFAGREDQPLLQTELDTADINGQLPRRSPLQPLQTEAPAPAGGNDVRRARLALYASHALAAWGQRAWEFAAGLVMLELAPGSLALVSAFGLLDAAAQVALGPVAGRYVDRTPRLRAACRLYLLQHAGVAASAGAALALLASGLRSGPGFWALLAVVIGAGSLGSVGGMGSTLSVEREWTKALCGRDSAELARINSGMKRIDLICLIASPICVGLLMTFGGSHPMLAATLAIAAWNLAAWGPECLLLVRAQSYSPAPREEKHHKLQAAPSSPAAGRGSKQSALSVYFSSEHKVLPAALALALLYLTVMSFGTLMTAYLKWSGMTEAELSGYRGLGALSGVLATLVFPPAQRRLGLVRVGAAAILSQLACLLVAAAPAAAAAAGAHLAGWAVTQTLALGLVLSRFGLWAFDLAVNQLIQEHTPGDKIGAVSGVQSSLQSAFQMSAYAAGLAVHRPQDFPFLMAASCVVVATAAVLYLRFALRSRFGAGLASGALEPI